MAGFIEIHERRRASSLRPHSVGSLPQGFPSLGAVTCIEQHIITIQVTIAPEHDAKPAGLDETDNDANAN